MSTSNPSSYRKSGTITEQQAQYAIIGILTFIFIWALLDFVEPDYNFMVQSGSEHLDGPFRWVMTIGFLALGIGHWYLASAANAALNAPVHSRTSVFLLRLASVGFLLAGLFPGYFNKALEELSQFEQISSSIHGNASFFAFISLYIAENTLSNRLRKAGKLKGKYKILQWLAIFAVFSMFLIEAPFTSEGIMQRIWLWVFLFHWGIRFAQGIRSGELLAE
jgi:hypothetical protein